MNIATVAIGIARQIRKTAEWLEYSVAGNDSYQSPEGGWACFHCGETFRTGGAARRHFGGRPDEVPRCKQLQRILAEVCADRKRLSDAVIAAEVRFREYGDLHAAKPDTAKAQRNYDMADQMKAALAPKDIVNDQS